MKKAFCGSRDYPDLEGVALRILNMDEDELAEMVLVSGGARGVDRRAERAAEAASIGIISYRVKQAPDGAYEVHRCIFDGEHEQWLVPTTMQFNFKSFAHAAFWRNDLILDEVAEDRDPRSGVIAFWDGDSSGTKYMVHHALQRRIDLEVHFPRG
jgi:hypothetical protein